jgi:hypothetical protein
VSRKQKVTRRRDDDPVRVYDDGRGAYWTGGAPGAGDRKIQRCGSREAAKLRASEVRKHLREQPAGRRAEGERDARRTDAGREGPLAEGRPPDRHHPPVPVGPERARAGRDRRRRLPRGRHRPVLRDLQPAQRGAGLRAGHRRGGPHPRRGGHVRRPQRVLPGLPAVRRAGPAQATVKQARATAAKQNRVRKKKRIRLDECPTAADVDKYAAAFEEEYPDYGARLVRLAFGTGLRINEALALRWDSIDLNTLDVAVQWQLDRYGNWPALALPKGDKQRTTQLWSC